MAGVLESLARGLRQGGGVLSPGVSQVISQEGMADDAERRRVELMQLQHRLQQEAQASDPRYQAQVEALKNDRLFRQEVAGAGGDMTRIAGAAVKYGKPELAVNLFNQQETRLARLQQARDAVEARQQELQMRLEDKALDRASREQANQMLIGLRQQSLALQTQLAQGNQQLRALQIQLGQDQLDLRRDIAANKPEKPLNEFQGKNVLFGSRAAVSDNILKSLEDKVSLVGLATKQAVGKTPLIGGALEAAGNLALSDEQQKVEQAQRDFVNAVLRQESGAVISDQEFANAKKQYFPSPGDSKAVIEQKRQNRQVAINGFKRLAGPGASSIDEALKEAGVSAKKANVPPPPDGFTVD